MNIFTLLVGASALFVAGCAAFFSVRGIGLLFAGSMIPVIIMASSLEFAKLVGASFLYRAWSDISVLMRIYMTVGVTFLVGITSLGIYGYLSDAFEDTKSRVYVYENNIVQLEKENKYLEEEIIKVENSADTVDAKAQQSEATFQKIYDDFIARQETKRKRVMERLAELDAAVAATEALPGGLFSSKKKKLAELEAAQSEERIDLRSRLKTMDDENDAEYRVFLEKVDNLRQTTQEVDVQPEVQELYEKIKTNNESVLSLKRDIKNTDIGSFKFIARTFDVELDKAVKWFIIVIVVVFDPMAVTLVIAYNIMLIRTTSRDKKKYVDHKEEPKHEIVVPETEEEVDRCDSELPVIDEEPEEVIDNSPPSKQNKTNTEESKPKAAPAEGSELTEGLKKTLSKAVRKVFRENPLLRRHANPQDLLEKLYADKKNNK